MFTNWFSPKSSTEQLVNPHDATLLDLYGHTQLEPARTPEPELVLQEEIICDPGTGQTIGSMPPDVDPVLSKKEAKNEELWSHLSRILELQNDIASLHLNLESGKPTEKREQGEKKGTWDRKEKSILGRGTDTYVGGDVGVDDEEDEATRRQMDRERKVKSLADHFVGHRERIDAIMSKVDQLSEALTTFHALQAPCLEFNGSRNNSLNTQTGEHTQPNEAVDLSPSPLHPSNVPSPIDPSNSGPPPPGPSTQHENIRPHLFLKTHDSAVAPPLLDSPSRDSILDSSS